MAGYRHPDGGAVTRPDDDREVPEGSDPEEDGELPKFETPLEAEPADVMEQAQELPTDDDDYRSA
jgi:hypothetical protein